MRCTFNLKKAYDDYYLYSVNTVYGRGEKPRSEYVSPYKENEYIPEHNITKQMCYNKLGQYEDIDESPAHLAKVKQALEIIKKDFSLFLNAENWKIDMHKYKQMYKERYDLLIEVLL